VAYGNLYHIAALLDFLFLLDGHSSLIYAINLNILIYLTEYLCINMFNSIFKR